MKGQTQRVFSSILTRKLPSKPSNAFLSRPPSLDCSGRSNISISWTPLPDCCQPKCHQQPPLRREPSKEADRYHQTAASNPWPPNCIDQTNNQTKTTRPSQSPTLLVGQNALSTYALFGSRKQYARTENSGTFDKSFGFADSWLAESPLAACTSELHRA